MKYLQIFKGFHLRLLLAFLFLSVLHFALGGFYKALLSEILIWAIYAMAFDLLYGYTGMISFGQALFFGLGGYGQMLIVLNWWPNLWLGLLTGLAVSALAGLGIGVVISRVREAYLAIITLLFATVFYSIANSWETFTGGADGYSFKVPPIDFGILSISLYDPTSNYFFVLFFFLLSYYVLRKITRSPFGMILKGIKENEERTRFLGYKIERYKMISFMISALFCGLAGALLAVTIRYHSAWNMGLTISANALVYAIIGGAGTLIGPVIGTAIMIFVIDFISSFTDNYQILVGALLVLTIIVAPRGLMGIITDSFSSLFSKKNVQQ